MIETLFPPNVETLLATPPMWDGPLLPEEKACLSPRAVEKRRREFTAGRVAARALLVRFGIRDFPLRAGPDRAPVWPTGIVGSLSHCGDLCGVAAARRDALDGIGLDIEHDRRLQEAVVRRICTAAELAHLATLPGGVDRWAIAIFCAKESVYKCHYPQARTFLDFDDVEVRLDPEAMRFAATIHAAAERPERALLGRLARHDRHLMAGVVSHPADTEALL